MSKSNPEARHQEHTAFLENLKLEPSASSSEDWCDIRKFYKVGHYYRGDMTVKGYGGELTLTINPNGTGRVAKLIVNGADQTDAALANGGDSITITPNSKYGYDCRKFDHYLAWSLTGQFVDWAAGLVEQYLKIARPSDFLLYARYYGPTDPKKWFYVWLLGWMNTEMHEVPKP